MMCDKVIEKLYVEYDNGKVCDITITYWGLIQHSIWYDRVIRL